MNRKQVLAAVIGVGAVTTGAAAQNAVQWRVEDGGNGHWYSVVESETSYFAADAAATKRGAYLVTIQSGAEQTFITSQVAPLKNFERAWMGLRQDEGAAEPRSGWRWVTGEPLADYTYWWTELQQPDDNACGQGIEEDFGAYAKDVGGAWLDLHPEAWPSATCSSIQTHSIFEWSADCNADGIVDYGQILSGELEDTNSNGVPDCCDIGASCDACAAADIDGNGDINGIDLAIILDKWGTNGGKDYPNADIDGDGTIAGADLAEVLGNWGACQ